MFWKLRLPLALTFIVGLVPIVTFFLSTQAPVIGPAVQFARDRVERYMVIIAGFALLLGVVSVVQGSVRKIERRRPGWPFAASLLAGLVVMGAFGILSAMRVGPFQGLLTAPDGGMTPFFWMTRNLFNPLQAAMFSLLAFYIASAAFRAFRVRNVEATILLIAAFIVMAGRTPLGEYAFGWLPGGERWLPAVTDWIMTVPNAAAQRGVIIGAALGAASLSLRVILGIERSYLGTTEK
ncbi:MAG: hypothetical protein FJY75_03200 [Candidatus Eisenbacteria bacterium]|uniref:Uncharacterized protein n=1 Tax=Eiseniibacteriota bacterium TaxID=2212470 RepID=A0A937X6M9_UNCEI|nr:hypothetical protein [Candidatus Eisenbacteria bacterium]